MKKLSAWIFTICFVSIPATSFAALNTLDGLGAKDQFLSAATGTNAVHMTIINVGTDTHTFQWDGTPVRIDQGGTGVTLLPTGILAGNGVSPLQAVIVDSPLAFSANHISCALATSTQSGCLSAADWARFDALTHATAGTNPAGSNLQIQFNANGVFGANSNLVYDPATGFFAAGTSTQYRSAEPWEFVSQTSSGSGTSLVATNYDTVLPFSSFMSRTARGTAANPLPIRAGDNIGQVGFNGFDGTSFPALASGAVKARATEAWTSTAHGTRLTFEVTRNGASSRSEAMRINATGDVTVGTTSDSAKLVVDGGNNGSALAVNGSVNINNGSVALGSGPVLLGTTTPRSQLTVQATNPFASAITAAGGIEIPNGNLNLSNGTINLAHGNLNLQDGCIAINGTCVLPGNSSASSQWITEGDNIRFPTTQGTVLLGQFATSSSSSAPGVRLSVHGHTRMDGNIDLYGFLKLPALTERETSGVFYCLEAAANHDGAVFGSTGPCLEKAITPALGVYPLAFWASNTSTDEAQGLYWDSINGRVGIGTQAPSHSLDVTTAGTTTVRIDSTSLTHGTCLIMKDADGGGYTYITTVNHQLVASDIPCQ